MCTSQIPALQAWATHTALEGVRGTWMTCAGNADGVEGGRAVGLGSTESFIYWYPVRLLGSLAEVQLDTLIRTELIGLQAEV